MTPTKSHSAQKWFDAGMAAHEKFVAAWKSARGYVFDAGYFFMKAREACANGDWGLFLQANAVGKKQRTVSFYMALAEAALTWAHEDDPQLPASKLPEAARRVMMMSPKPLVALLRDLRELRPFGEYDAIKYLDKKRGASIQLELEFEKAFGPALLILQHRDDPNFTLNFGEGKTENQGWQELKQMGEALAAMATSRIATDI